MSTQRKPRRRRTAIAKSAVKKPLAVWPATARRGRSIEHKLAYAKPSEADFRAGAIENPLLLDLRTTPPSAGIFYANHTVQTLGVRTPFEHSKVIIAIDPRNRFWDVRPFGDLEGSGLRWITLGAGPNYATDRERGTNGFGTGGMMWAAVNRRTDIELPFQGIEILSPPARYADVETAITALLGLMNCYNLSPIPYTLFPGRGTRGLNSNSFVRGLLEAADFTPPAAPRGDVAGWNTPVPRKEFGIDD